MTREALERRIRRWLVFFVIALALSGLTAFPLEIETRWLYEIVSNPRLPFAERWPELVGWVRLVQQAIADTYARYPFVAYGTDWLAFAHIVIGLAFFGVLRDPVRNKWIIEWGLWSCALVVVLAFAWAPFRDIPFFWRCVDASFGVIGAIPLWLVHRDIRTLEQRA